MSGGHFEEAELLLVREKEAKAALGGRASDGAVLPVVEVADLQAVVAQWSGVPVAEVEEGERQRLAVLVRG